MAVEDAATYFGKVSFEIRSHVEAGYIEARLELPQNFRGKEVWLRVRHPEGKKIARAAIDNGRSVLAG